MLRPAVKLALDLLCRELAERMEQLCLRRVALGLACEGRRVDYVPAVNEGTTSVRDTTQMQAASRVT